MILTVDAVKEFDVCVTMGCGHVCPSAPARFTWTGSWTAPADQGVEAACPIRDQIKTMVVDLITGIAAAKPEATA